MCYPFLNARISKALLSFILVLFFPSANELFGQSIFTNPITGTNPNTSNPYTIGQTVNANITVSGIGRGSGIAGSAANDRYNATAWNAASLSTTKYFEFTITPNAGYAINFSNFVYTGQASGTGATSAALRSSLDAYAANIGTANITGTTISLTAGTYQNITSAITFRFYGWGASAAGGTFSINDFTFNGTVVSTATPAIAISAVPPSANTINPSTTVILQKYTLAVTSAAATLSGLSVVTSGTYVGADISNLKVRYSTDATLDAGDATLSTFTSPGAAGTKTFPSFTSQSISSGATITLFITADIAAGATGGNTIQIASNALSNFSFSSGTKSGTDPAIAGGIQTIVIPITVPTLTLPTASSVTSTSAILGANISSTGGASISARGTVWGTAASPIINALAEGGTSTGIFSHSRTGFTPNTLYYYRGYAVNSAGTGYSSDGTFNTLQTAPTGISTSAVNYSGFTVSWTAPGNGPLTYTYQLQIDNDIAFGSPAVDVASINSSTLSYTSNSLTTNLPYYIRMRSTNAGGNGTWSSIVGPITPTPVAEPSNQASSFSCSVTGVTTLGVSWTDAIGSPSPSAYLICWSLISDVDIPVPVDGVFTANGSNSLNVSAGIQSASLTGLVGNTTYFIRIYAYTNGGSFVNYNVISTPTSSCTTLDGPCATEDFSAIGTAATYGTRTWTGAGGTWTASDSREDQTITGKAITIRNGTLLSPLMSGGLAQIRLKTQRKFTGITGTMAVKVNGNVVGTIAYDGTVQTVTLSNINISGNYTLEIMTPSGSGDRVAIDDLELFCFAGICTVTNPTTLTLTPANTSGTISWTTPSCSDEVLVVVKAASAVTAIPSGDGSAYITASIFGTPISNTALPANEFAIYRGSSSAATITNLVNGTLYYVTVYSRKGTTWSAGISGSFIPSQYCVPSISNACDEYISAVILGSINNSSAASCGTNGYSNYSNLTSAVVQGQSYSITVNVGIVGDAPDISYLNDDIRIWADWNHDGDFLDTDETLVNLNNNAASGTYTFSVPVSATLGSTQLRIRIVYDNETSACGVATYGETEDYQLSVQAPCTPIASISSFLPANGPAGTRVSISGTNFTGSSAVYFNSVISPEITLISNSLLIAQVPEGAGTGTIRVIDASGCAVNSASSFSFLSQSGTCNNAYSELFISEIYDPQTGNNHYIELYNGTLQTINLTSPNNYTMKLLNKASASDANPTVINLDITGSIAPNEMLVVYAGGNGGLSTSPAQGFANGFNDYDEIQLLKNGAIIDLVQGPNNVGYDYKRINTISGPNVVYTAAEWIRTETGENSSDIGIFTTNPTFNITVHPSDLQAAPCDPLFMSTLSDQGTASYQWKMFNGSTWVSIVPGTGISGYNTANLTINPSIGYAGYQFYCEISKAICIKQSNAAVFTEIPNDKRLFRSTGSGNWNTTGQWEYAVNAGGPWLPSCFSPTAINSDQVSILNGHTLTIAGFDLSIDQLTVDNGGALILSSTDALILENGAGVDFIVNGTFTDNSNSGSGNGVTMNGGATWQMGATGTFVKTSTSSFAVFRDNYEAGMSTIPSSATMIMRSVTGSNPSFTAVGNTYYPNLIFESTSGLWNPPISTSRFGGSTDFPTIKGNLDIGGTGSGTVIIYNQNTNATPITVLGNTNIRSGSTLTNNGTFTGTGFDLKGNLTVDGNLIVDEFGSGNYLKLSGTTPQVISGTGSISIAKCIAQNSSITGIDLQRDLTISKQLDFISGAISTNTFLMQLGTSTAQTGVLNYTSGYVLGKMRRWFNGTNSGNSTALFPIGIYSGSYRNHSVSIEYTQAPTLPGHVTVEFISLPMASVNSGLPILAANTGGAAFDVQYLEDEGYWKIDNETGKLTDGLYTISLTGEGFQTITDINQVTLLKRVNGGSWFCPGIHIPATGTTSIPTIARSGVSGYSNFGFGSGGNNPLPVELVEFNGMQADQSIQLNWLTASEINAAYFTVERSSDAVSFRALGNVAAHSISNQKREYALIDNSPSIGINYYRLNQFDWNGKNEYSEVIAVNYETLNSSPFIEWVHVDDRQNLSFYTSNNTSEITIRWFDISGRIVNEQSVSASGFIQTNANQHLQNGLYLVQFTDGKNEFVAKIIIK